MTQQPEAQRLADAIDPFVRKHSPDHLTSSVAAAELRRLHAEVVMCHTEIGNQAKKVSALYDENAGLLEQNTALDAACARLERVNAQLLEALGELIAPHGGTIGMVSHDERAVKARAAIAAAKEGA